VFWLILGDESATLQLHFREDFFSALTAVTAGCCPLTLSGIHTARSTARHCAALRSAAQWCAALL